MPISIEERVRGTELFFEHYLRGYRDRVNQYYIEEYGKNNECFSLMHPTLLMAVHFIEESHFLFINSDSDDFVNIIATQEQNIEYAQLESAPEHKKNEYIYRLCQLESDQIKKHKNLRELGTHSLIVFRKSNHPILSKDGYQWGIKEADSDFNTYQLAEALKETIQPSSDYHLFDVEPLIEKVKDDQFQYEFTEAIKAYNSQLYLASTITAAVAIETLLQKVIVDKLGENYLPAEEKERYITKLAGILEKNGIIEKRLHHRIRSANELRRGSGHSKSGKMEAIDAQHMFAVIKSIVDELF